MPKPIKNAAGKAFLRTKNSILGLYSVKITLKRNQGQVKDNTDLTTHENEEYLYTRIEMTFNSIMTQFFQGSDNSDLIERMLAYIKAQTENPKFHESGFTLDKIMHLYINFHRLELTRGSSYIKLLEWIKNKKAMINPQNKDEERFEGLSLKHHITKMLTIILRELACAGVMKISIIGKVLSFRYRLRRLISLKRTTLA